METLANHPNLLSNKDIQAIAEKYSQNKSLIANLFETPTISQLAENLKNYNKENEPQQKWLFLAETFKSLPTSNHEIGKEIINLFRKAFNFDEYYFKKLPSLHPTTVSSLLADNANAYFKNKNTFKRLTAEKTSYLNVFSPDKLTNGIIHQIGEEYLQNHGENPSLFSRFFHLHTNQPVAKRLKSISEINPEKRWLTLANIYRSLPNSRGEIAHAIITLFKNAFAATELNKINSLSNMDETTAHLRSIITEHYAKNKHRFFTIPNPFLSRDLTSEVKDFGRSMVLNAATKILLN